jgi:hypothetical protein
MTHSASVLQMEFLMTGFVILMTGFVISMFSALALPFTEEIDALPFFPSLIASRQILIVTLEIVGNVLLGVIKVNSKLFQLDHLICFIFRVA